MNWQNKLTDLFKINYPLIQAPMLGVTSPEMVAAVANNGGLGSLPLGGLSPEKCAGLIAQTKSQTARPFAVNLFAHSVPKKNNRALEDMQNLLSSIGQEQNIPYKKPTATDWQFYTYEEQIEVILREKIPVVSFTFGILKDEIIQALQQNGTILIGTCTSVKEAQLLAEKEIAVIVAQGIEAGGHRGSFLYDDAAIPQVGTFSLVPQIADCIKQPIIAAGGVFDGRTINAAFVLGAAGVQVGSAFITAEESLAVEQYKAAIKNSDATDTVLTKSFSGRWARGIRNTFMQKIENAGLPIPAYPYQNVLTAGLRKTAKEEGQTEFMSLWCGQSGANAKLKPTAEILKELVADTEKVNAQYFQTGRKAT